MALIVYRKQRQILGPTLKQIAEAIGVSSLATVHEHLQSLEAKGLIKRKQGKVRSIELTEGDTSLEKSENFNVPILGYIAAGLPIEAYTDPNASMNIPASFVSGSKRTYVLQVRGESMIEDGIRDGDNVIVEQTEHAKDGDVVVALLDNGMATLKRFYKEATRIRLQPANSTMQPIFVKNVRIQGRVVGLIRRYKN
ncbi:MAG: LexA repressor [Candidatus Woesebacteria bacterium GW2011_GWC2_40_30]|nr:MAG: LexA repressor [Candidatus Woesebacteria bacterium GW2011_GWC2_40_30]